MNVIPVQPGQLEIDQKILHHEASIRELRSCRNLVMPVCKLPVEVLCRIFALYIENWTYGRHWTAITHVCRFFRTVALNCPTLWSKPEFSRPQLAYEMIKRSKMAPLAIETSGYSIPPRAWDIVIESLSEISRITTINVSASPENMAKFVDRLRDPAPFLHTLSLQFLSDSYTLPSEFLAGDASRLSRICLVRCHLGWDSPILCNLTHLKVHNPSVAPILDQFIAALAKMPNLEILDLVNALPDKIATTKPQISLPRLRILIIAGALNHCWIFVKYVLFPASTFIEIRAESREPPDNGALALVGEICRRLPIAQSMMGTGTGIRAFRSLSVMRNHTNMVTVEGHDELPAGTNSTTRDIPISFASTKLTGCFVLQLSWLGFLEEQLCAKLAAVISSSLPLTSLRDFHISGAWSLSALANFRSLNNIRMLTAEGEVVGNIVEMLIPQAVHSKVAFPALKTFKVLDADFDPDRGGSTTLIKRLLKCLVARQKHKAKLLKLFLSDCTCLSDDDVEEIGNFVDVEWDGIECGYTEEEEEEYSDDYDDIYGSY